MLLRQHASIHVCVIHTSVMAHFGANRLNLTTHDAGAWHGGWPKKDKDAGTKLSRANAH